MVEMGNPKINVYAVVDRSADKSVIMVIKGDKEEKIEVWLSPEQAKKLSNQLVAFIDI